MVLRIWVVAWALLLAFEAPASAVSDSDEATEEARRHVNAAKVAYTLGEFDNAIVAWKEAYRLKPLPSILFNLAQALRMAGEYKESRFQYQNYLRGTPNAPNRLEVERWIKQLGPLIAAQEEADSAPPDTPEIERSPAPSVVAVSESVHSPPPAEAVVTKFESPVEPAANVVELPDDVFNDPSVGSSSAIAGWVPWVVAGGAVVLATFSALAYSGANEHWDKVTTTENPRYDVDRYIADGDSDHSLALGLGGAAAAVGIGSAVLFVF